MRAAYTAIAARYGEPTAPPRPDTIVSAEVCPLSGKRPGPSCEHGKRELFIVGHVPEDACDWHQRVWGPSVIYPDAVRAWTRFYGRPAPPVCGPPEAQRPPLSALPAAADLRWTIDGEPADTWIRNRHTVATTPHCTDSSEGVSFISGAAIAVAAEPAADRAPRSRLTSTGLDAPALRLPGMNDISAILADSRTCRVDLA